MARPHSLVLGALIASAPAALGCAQILGDYEVAESSSGGTTSASGVAASSGAGGGSSVGATAGSGSGSGSASSGGQPDAGQDPCGLGSTAGLQDDFSDGTPMPLWEPYTEDNTHINATEANGELTITTDGFGTTAGEGPFAGYRSAGMPLSFLGCSMAVMVKNVNITGDMAVRVELVDDSDMSAVKRLRISLVGPNMVFHNYVNGDPNAGDPNQKSLAYSATTHLWWRFREDQGTTYSETSSDGKTWVTQYNIPTPPFASLVRVNLTLGTKKLATANGSVTFDNVNILPP